MQNVEDKQQQNNKKRFVWGMPFKRDLVLCFQVAYSTCPAIHSTYIPTGTLN